MSNISDRVDAVGDLSFLGSYAYKKADEYVHEST